MTRRIGFCAMWTGETLLIVAQDGEAEQFGVTPKPVPGLWRIAELLRWITWVICKGVTE